MIPAVFLFIFLFTSSTSIQPVLGSMSQKTGFPPALTTALAVAIKVWVGTKTSLFLTSKASRQISRAVPPEFTAIENLELNILEVFFQNF